MYINCAQAEESEIELSEWKRILQNLSLEEKQILESFFRTMLVNSEGGFVLLGSKPACIEGIFATDKYSLRQIGRKSHQRSIVLTAGYQVWKDHFNKMPSSKLIICCKQASHKLYSEWIHLLWINPKKLIEVVQNNLALFQYVLGPQLTPESFLHFLSDPVQDVPTDNTLTGVFLGFGTKNSIYYRRLELIESQLCSREKPPFNPINQRLNISKMDYLGFDKCRSADTEPSFNYLTLRDEYKDIKEIRPASSCKISPFSILHIPLFAIYEFDQETQDILSNYQTHQQKIENLLMIEDFLEQVLKWIFE